MRAPWCAISSTDGTRFRAQARAADAARSRGYDGYAKPAGRSVYRPRGRSADGIRRRKRTRPERGPETKFRIGSITKQFTAASILLLQERGKLNVHDLLKKYMPDAPPAWDKVTIFNLLTHTSRIPNYTDLPDFRSEMRVPETPLEIIAHVRNKPLDFAPGTRWRYSNSGYIVLGYVIEKVSGMPCAQFFQQNIFGPLGMRDSGYDTNAKLIEHRATGYVPAPAGCRSPLQPGDCIRRRRIFCAGSSLSLEASFSRMPRSRQ